jgi:hypothetical protein
MASQERYEELQDDQGTEGQAQPGVFRPAAAPAEAPRNEAGAGGPDDAPERMGGTADLLGGTGGTRGSSDASGSPGPAGSGGDALADSGTTPLLPPEETGRFRQQWESIQVGFTARGL